ncbi:MAG: N-acetyltransferase family protein [Woeseia sp.]
MTEISTLVRPSEDQDAAAIAGIYSHHVLQGSASFETNPPGRKEMARRRAALLGRGMPYIVAERDGQVVGFAYAAPYHERPAYRSTVEDSLYVRADSMGMGIGRMLLSTLISDCKNLGFRQMVALIGDSDNAASIRLHESMGFRRVGTLRSVGFKFGRWLDVVQMQRELGTGDRTAP